MVALRCLLTAVVAWSLLLATPAGAVTPPGRGAVPVVSVGRHDPRWGPAEAPVTIVGFLDLQCPFCKRVMPTLEKVRRAYRGRVRFVWKHLPLPFHKLAAPAARWGAAVHAVGGSQAFFKYVALVFADQRQLSPAKLSLWAEQSVNNGAALRRAYRRGGGAKKLAADAADARRYGIRGTPGFLINGALVSGAQSFTKFKEVIDRELVAAKALRRQGVPAREVHRRRFATNYTAPAKRKAASRKPKDTTVWQVPVDRDDPVRGRRDALVTIVEYGDFQCPFCRRVEATLERLLREYPREVRIVWKDNPLPFHKHADEAAILGRLAFQRGGSRMFWKVHRRLYDQKRLDDATIAAVAKEHGLPWPLPKAQAERLLKIAEKKQAQGRDIKARGTPHFFVNGRRLAGAQPYDEFKALVDERLADAKAALKKGERRWGFYARLAARAKKPPGPVKKKAPPVESWNPSRGPKHAPVVIQEFADFQCPFCARVQPTLTQLMREYPGKVRLVFRHMPLPFHKQARPAALAALEAYAQQGDQGFWSLHDRLFSSHRQLSSSAIQRLSALQGLDPSRVFAAMGGGVHDQRLAADMAAGKAAGVSGTPAFFVGDYFLSGAQPLSEFKQRVELVLRGSP